ncbi:MAG TPA: aminotransferase class V-fold PLP-dependent enzyme [Planctomycetota bacterium]|nr:aminotransferase class V-fold PLP-dependent enzyme [Planctomycetota bacterium]
MSPSTFWRLDPEVTFLNHGSFGACPGPVLDAQGELRARLEREPVLFMQRQLERLLDGARARLAEFVRADPDDLAFVANATTGVNTVLRSLELSPGDELVTTDHEYNACRNALEAVARAARARVVVVPIPFPLPDPDVVVDAVVGAITERTKLLLIDHVTSPTGLVLPIERIIPAYRERGIDVLVDGAHAPGMLDLDLNALGATYYTGNCHKWMCAPKGAALLWVRRDRQERVHPLVISHGANSTRTDRSRFRLEFDFTGTDDYTAYLSVPAAIDALGTLFPGGWKELRERNRRLALEGRDILCRVLRIPPPAPDSMIGSLAAVPIPEASPGGLDADLNHLLFDHHRIEVPVPVWPRWPKRLLRISAQAYNDRTQYERLASVLQTIGLAPR